MNAPEPHPISSDAEQQMRDILALQRDSYIAEGEVSAATRIDRIQRTIEVLVQNAEKISEAMNADFGCRPRQVNLMTDVTGSLYNPADASMEASDGLNPVSSQGYVEVQAVEAIAMANAGQIDAPAWDE